MLWVVRVWIEDPCCPSIPSDQWALLGPLHRWGPLDPLILSDRLDPSFLLGLLGPCSQLDRLGPLRPWDLFVQLDPLGRLNLVFRACPWGPPVQEYHAGLPVLLDHLRDRLGRLNPAHPSDLG